MHTLGDTPPSWDQLLDASNGSAGGIPPAGCNSDRFKCVMVVTSGCNPICVVTYPAVLDEETGLVWQRSPSTATQTWATAAYICQAASTGGRGGWRVPTQAELGSLIGGSAGILPSGHPFTNISGLYWSSTEALSPAGSAYALGQGSWGALDKTSEQHLWCVRGASSTR